MEALALGASHRQRLIDLMEQKDRVGDCFNQLRLALQRHTAELPAQVGPWGGGQGGGEEVGTGGSTAAVGATSGKLSQLGEKSVHTPTWEWNHV